MSKYLEPTLAAVLSICSTSKYLHLSCCIYLLNFLRLSRELDCLLCLRAGGGRAGELFVSLNFLDQLQSGGQQLGALCHWHPLEGERCHPPPAAAAVLLHCSHKALNLLWAASCYQVWWRHDDQISSSSAGIEAAQECGECCPRYSVTRHQARSPLSSTLL